MIRFCMLIILFLVSLLSFSRAPAYYLWLLAIGVTEFPLVFAGATVLLITSGIWLRKYRHAGTIIGIITLLIFLSSIFRAYGVAKGIAQDMVKSLTDTTGPNQPVLFKSDTPFGFWNLFKGTTEVPYKTLTYVKYSDTSMSMDFYQAKAFNLSSLHPAIDLPEIPSDKHPCVIIVHGGSWAGGDNKQLPELNSYLATKGYNVAAINYRLAPKYQTPAPVEDIRAAIAYLKKHANELHIDTTNFVLLGRSAGAQIALLAAYTMHEASLKGVIDFYGPADMVWGYSKPSNPLIMNSRKVMGDYVGGTYKQVPEKYFASSPLEFVSRQSVPTLIIHGGNDVLVSPEHSRRLNLKLQQHGIKHYWLKLPWATHGFDYNLNGPGGQLSTYAVETFLNTITQ